MLHSSCPPSSASMAFIMSVWTLLLNGNSCHEMSDCVPVRNAQTQRKC